MTIRASAGSAFILAAGLLVSFAAPPPAMAAGADGAAVSKPEGATSEKPVRHSSRYLKKRYAHRNSTRASTKSAEDKKPDEKQVADASGRTPPAMPEWLANANAQMTAADAPSDSAKGMSAAMSEKANTVLQAAVDKPADADAQADATVVASDQLNDVDRALQATPPEGSATQTVAMASTKPASEDADQAANNDSSTLDKTSLIGKIFIAFGALLTMASAARMFMA
ncbi:hypothetical protein [Bradyrhizobium australiense]|uniref:Uncharacterized protein n=1 Tax=Bradyrhizobium australiense TaxID=2721161 RepID=A0A7Y4GX14_9BRAD|nr:hypothetical protein [Bradyrhizobium australiense]NOJ43451.1 hypothetical protein [Bradyrhizobium australiense]